MSKGRPQTVLRLVSEHTIDKGIVQCVEVTVFYPSGKRKSKCALEDYSPETQELLKQHFAVLDAVTPLTKEQYQMRQREARWTGVW